MRYRLNDYSVPMTYGHRQVLVRGYVHEVVISCGAETIARHVRSYEREDKTVHLAPGMTVSVEVKTGARAIIDYLLSPIGRYRQESFRER